MIQGFRRKRLPRLGKIGLGAKVTKNGREFPQDLTYFDVSECPEVAAVYGPQPTDLEVMVPAVDIEQWFPIALKRYGTDRLLCRGDGSTATEFNATTGEWEDIPCGYKDCPHFAAKRCTEVGNLMVILPKVNIMGVYQIDTGSFHGINRIYDAYEMALQRIVDITGRPDDVLRVHFRLVRTPEEIQYTGVDKAGNPQRKTVTKCLLNLLPPALSLDEAKQLHAAIATERRQLTAGTRAALPAAPTEFDDDDDFGGVPEVDESQPVDLYPGAAPAAATLEQRAELAELLEQAAECGADPAEVEMTVCSQFGATAFADLSEEQAAQALEQVKVTAQQWAAKSGTEAPAATARPSEGQLTAWAALLAQVQEAGKAVPVVVKSVIGDAEFATLSEEQGTEAIAKLSKMLQNWQGGAKPKTPRSKPNGNGNGTKAPAPAPATDGQATFNV